MQTVLPAASMVLAICTHPDDESFGLGAVLDAYSAAGVRAAALCFTAGEATSPPVDQSRR
jgi:LmbE family N-acetylglucosaminyl deacetylase